VVLGAELIAADGTVIAGSRLERVIAREVELDLSRELSDTRLLPGQSVALVYRRRVEGAGIRARVTVTVYPDAFYTRFFATLLEQGQAGQGQGQIREALAASRRSRFTVFERELPLS
jgi:hypothetical protein